MYGAPNFPYAKKIMLLGSGELGKEVILEAQRLGIETIAVDRYEHAPAMQVAHRFHVIDMLDEQALRNVIALEKPDFIVPEVEAINTALLVDLEAQGQCVIPTAKACQLTMNREGIRRLAAEELGLPTANYEFADSLAQLRAAVEQIGLPCVIKPIMSSSGKGQSICRTESDIETSWTYAMEGARTKLPRVIVEEFIHFESEITLLTVRSVSGTFFCPPIGHVQKDGDYIESWQPHAMTAVQLERSQSIAQTITDALGGRGIYGVELFLGPNDQVWFSEVSPRPHDTGMVTMVSQEWSEFALHVRAILGFPIESIRQWTPGASYTLKATQSMEHYQVSGVTEALTVPGTQVRVFGKPSAYPGRRIAVALSSGETVSQARERAKEAADKLGLI